MPVPRSSAVAVTTTLFMMGAVEQAFAITDSGAWGSNRLNQTVYIVGSEIYTDKNDSKGRRAGPTVSTVPFNGECSWSGQTSTVDAHALDCQRGTVSPLAGAYFSIRFSKAHRNQCGRGSIIYECISGCQPSRVPRVLVEEPYEC
jgi:hypothetical protein